MPTLSEVRAQQKAYFDQACAILSPTGGAITEQTSNEDRARLAELKSKMLENGIIEDRLRADQADSAYFTAGRDAYSRPVEQHHQPGDPSRSPFTRSIGDGVVRSAEYATGIKNMQPSFRVTVPGEAGFVDHVKGAGRERKGLITGASDTSGGAFVVADRQTGYTSVARGELAFLDALPTIPTTSDLIEWVEQTSRTNAAAPTAEATASTGTSGTKPESGVAFVVNSRGVESIPTHIPMTTRAIADAPQLRSAIDDELLYMLREELEEQCMIGTGNSPELLGLNVWTGTQTMALAGNAADTIFNAALAVRFTGGVPATSAIVGPTTLAALRLMRENAATGTLGNYLFGPPNQPGPMTIFGLEVLTAQATPANTAFVLNMTPTTLALYVRQGGTIETGYINDDFTRNIVRIRAELRAAMVVRRPKGIVKISGMP